MAIAVGGVGEVGVGPQNSWEKGGRPWLAGTRMRAVASAAAALRLEGRLEAGGARAVPEAPGGSPRAAEEVA